LFRQELEAQGAGWPPLAAGMFRKEPEFALSVIAAIEKYWRQHHQF
jgi:hypothetical protein